MPATSSSALFPLKWALKFVLHGPGGLADLRALSTAYDSNDFKLGGYGSVYLRAILRSKLSVAIAKVALIKALFFIQCAALAKLVGDIHENPPQTLVPAPTLKTAR